MLRWAVFLALTILGIGAPLTVAVLKDIEIDKLRQSAASCEVSR